jgi:hypothetical protein
MTFGIDANRLVVCERVQNLTLGPLSSRLLVTYWAVDGESDEHFSHGILLAKQSLMTSGSQMREITQSEVYEGAGENAAIQVESPLFPLASEGRDHASMWDFECHGGSTAAQCDRAVEHLRE